MMMTASVTPSTLVEQQQEPRLPSSPPEPPQQLKTLHPPPLLSLSKLLESDNSSDFALFKLKQEVPIHVILFICLQTIVMLTVIFRSTIGSIRDTVPFATKVASFVRLLVPLTEWVYLYYSRKYAHSNVLTAEGKRIIFLGNIILLLQTVCVGGVLLSWVIARKHCQSDLCEDDLPEGVFYILCINMFITTIGMPIFFPCHDIRISFISICLASSGLLASIILYPVIPIVRGSLVFAGLIDVLILRCFYGILFSSFTSFSNFETALRLNILNENKEFLMKKQTEEMRHMIGNVAHDLRTPLQAFQSEMEILRGNISNGTNDKTVLLSSIQQLERICHFMNMTINRSIDFTKASSGIKLNPSIEIINFSETLNWAVGCMSQSDAKVPIVVLPIPEIIYNYIYTDKQWLMENLLCLLSNALKFTTEGEITIRCSLEESAYDGGAIVQTSNVVELDSVETRKATLLDVESGLGESLGEEKSVEVNDVSQMLRIEVEDTGIGITTENQGQLFQPFMQAQRRTGGTGLGLYALSKRLDSLGGKCGVKDRFDGTSGSCFWISIPFKPAAESEEDVTHHSGSLELSLRRNSDSISMSDRSSSFSLMSRIMKQNGNMDGTENFALPLPSLHILLVDDSTLIQKTTSRALIKEGHRVEVAQHGAECLKILESSQLSPCVYSFDLILMDLQMPVMDGFEATRRIRALERSMQGGSSSENSENPHITIIGVTANTEGDARVDCMECGMDGFMEKPLKVRHFHEYLFSDSINLFSGGEGSGFRKM